MECLEERLFKALPVIWAEVEVALELPGGDVSRKYAMAEMAAMVFQSRHQLVSTLLRWRRRGGGKSSEVLVRGWWLWGRRWMVRKSEALSADGSPNTEVAGGGVTLFM